MSSYSTDTYSITSTGIISEISTGWGGSAKYSKWILTYSLNGEIHDLEMYAGANADATEAAATLNITGYGDTVNEAGYYLSNIEYVSINFDTEETFPLDQVVDRGGLSDEGPPTTRTTGSELAVAAGLTVDVEMVPGLTVAMETAVAESAARTERAAAAAEPHSALYISSMSQTIRLNRKTGLIAQDSFRLKWNDMRYPENWSQEVTQKYNEIQSGADPGKIAVIKNNIYIPHSESGAGYNSYNLFYDLNTGMKQMAPHVERQQKLDGGVDSFSETETATCDVYYGRVEGDALEDKYKRFSGDYSTAMDSTIDGIVNDAISQMRTKSKYNFKRVDTNKKFRRKNLSLFSEEGRMTEAIEVTTATAISTAPMSTARGSSY